MQVFPELERVGFLPVVWKRSECLRPTGFRARGSPATCDSSIETRRDASCLHSKAHGCLHGDVKSPLQELFEVTDSMQNLFLGKHLILGKHFVFDFCAVLLLTFGPVRVACAQHWWQHTGPGPMGSGADQKAESPKQSTGKAQFEKPTPIYTSPKSIGWWCKTPAPMGAGADTKFYFYSKWTKPRFRRAQGEKLTPIYTSPKSVGWWNKSPGPLGAGSGKP